MMPFYKENRTNSNVVPVCLPWKSNDPGRQLGQNLVLFSSCYQNFKMRKIIFGVRPLSGNPRQFGKLTEILFKVTANGFVTHVLFEI